MRVKSVLWLAPLSLAIAPACSSASPGKAATQPAPVSRSTGGVTVRPAVGGPRTRFLVAFRAVSGRPASGSQARHYVVTATGPHGQGCASTASGAATGVRLGSIADVALTAPAEGWCPGTYQGRVGLLLTPVCAPGHECPMYVINGGTIGRFSFRVVVK